MSIFSEGQDGRESRPEFTDEEIRLIRLWSLSDGSAGGQVSAQVAYFATPAVFGIYGLATGSLVIVGVAFVCILLLLAWGFVSTWRDQRTFGLMRSICAKVLAMLPAGDERK
ncbi:MULTISPECIES: hypothetical protein [unclassified Ensifer]|uniref:hypothetical protein n=1 Tax=unclassified Ensifer TaxID=2633371 RepID=UPI000813611D|nr:MULTISPECIES: hypothetical protein [unclassified Ensifer]OCP18898.1 hypothetical protein BC363_07075 [Ensifer sp. LC384]OCP27937.1 hypothetical protein BC361_00555 [Ensifer sp. LC54]